MRKRFRTIFFGTPQFVIPVVELLFKEEDLLAVVTQPDKPRGRGLKSTPSPVKIWAMGKGLPVLEPLKLKDDGFLKDIKSLAPDLIVVFAYGKILPRELLEIPKEGCWNIHLSLLPKYRGASPVQWALLNGEEETGVTIMLMDEGMDTGPILLQKALTIEPSENSATLTERLSILSVDALREAISLYKEGKLQAKPQENEKASFATLIKKEDGLVTFEDKAIQLERKIRAFYPWPGTFTMFRNKILKIHRAKAVSVAEEQPPGKILKIDRDGILVSTSQGALLLEEVQLEGKQRVSAYEFAIGQRLKAGENLL
ncbi:MAG: methionyl-tRNA formyltransferase [Caldimicrobium sp.]|nr:methionyl-tRNA formyltransferase [Caldimicrobium sp.]MCX7612950.1 methionyl-tRNA formyltransferase [Caldimicrobium sp.]MDW8182900.1 methionyl-tRNA formyltransferase [Caldimicrobium sp.]